jgi:hypothetical protein
MLVLFEFALIYLIWLLSWVVVLAWRYREMIVACWRESVLSKPVLIFESDDWGPGANGDAYQLSVIANLLKKYSDSLGRHPVMTLGTILAVPDNSRIKASDYKCYYKHTLDEVQFRPILQEIRDGLDGGVFSVQLHGMEHYWPDNLMAALGSNADLSAILEQQYPLRTERLPSELQSRWIRLGKGSSELLSEAEIARAVKEEAAAFISIFQQAARVVVPPTFVWNQDVESNWVKHGVAYLVTPGFICEGRDNQGVIVQSNRIIYNGLRADSGLLYIVRNNYFEPTLGHTPAQAIAALGANTRLGRPTLLEIHRFNFFDATEQSKSSLLMLDQCIGSALTKYPDLRFISTSELGDMYADPDSVGSLIDKRLATRVFVFMDRLLACEAMRKWLYLSGLFVLVKSISVFNTGRKLR